MKTNSLQRKEIMNKSYQSILILILSLFISNSYTQSPAELNSKYTLHTVVIDAGHGGHDNGTAGKNFKEKDVALDIALRLGRQIESKYPNIKVIYTRQTDKFVPLRERAAIANRNRADLFISIHCNGGSHTASGTETFVLGLHRNEDNLKVAMRENNSILLEDNYTSHYGSFDPSSPEAYILFNLVQNANLDQSIDFAQAIENKFTGNGRNSRGVKQAGFLVLRETTMPSVLIETGFLTNHNEENFIASSQGKQKIASSIFNAFERYQQNLQAEYARILEKRAAEDARFAAEQKRIQEEKARKDEASWAWPSIRSLQLKGDKYFVQLFVSAAYNKGKEDFPFDNVKMEPIAVINSFKYLIGPYNTESEAKTAHKKAQEQGFRDAYILKYTNGKVVR